MYAAEKSLGIRNAQVVMIHGLLLNVVARVPGPGTKEKRLRLDIVTVGYDIATVTLVYKIRGTEMTGRQMQTWVRFPDVGWKVIAAHVSMIAETPVL